MKFIFVALFFIIYTVSGATIYEYIPGIEYGGQVYVPLSQVVRVTRNADARHYHEEYHHPYMPPSLAHNSADAHANSAIGSFQTGGPPFGAGFGGYPTNGGGYGGHPSIGYTPGFGGGNGAGKANAGASAGGFGNTQSTANAQSQTFTGNGFSGSASSASSSSSSTSFDGRRQQGFDGFGNFGQNSLSTAQAQSVS